MQRRAANTQHLCVLPTMRRWFRRGNGKCKAALPPDSDFPYSAIILPFRTIRYGVCPGRRSGLRCTLCRNRAHVPWPRSPVWRALRSRRAPRPPAV